MHRKFIATILAAAIAVTSVGTTSAQAGNRELHRLLVGAAALAIIGGAIAAENNRQTTTTHYTHKPKPKPKAHHNNHYKNHGYNNHGHKQGHKQYKQYKNHNQGYKKKHAGKFTPRKCMRNVMTRHGWTQGYAVKCTRNNVRRPAALPSDCVRRNFANGPRKFYAPRCLRKYGYNA